MTTCKECRKDLDKEPHLPNCTEGMLGKVEDAVNLSSGKEVAIETPAPDNGDCYDEDTGTYLGQLTDTQLTEEASLETLPAQIALFHAGYWYVFKPSHRYKEDDTKPNPS